MKRIITYSLCLLLFLSGCIEEFDATKDVQTKNGLVVEARLSNENKFTYVKLTRSVSLGSNGQVPAISDALVEIIDSANNCFELIVNGFGLYILDNDKFEPQINESYQLHIVLNNGKEYLSEPEVLPEPIPLGTIEPQFIWEKVRINGTLRSVQLINFIEKSQQYDVKADSLYFFHDHEGVYAFQAPFQGSDACEEGGTRSPSEEIRVICYRSGKTDLPSNVSVIATDGLNSNYNVMQLRPGFEFLIGYSMIVRRHRINKGYYEYITALKQQSDYGGSIFDAPPFKVLGNISNVEDENDLALGYFYAEASTYSERLFVDNKEIVGVIYENRNELECYNNFDLERIFELPESEVVRPSLSCCDCTKAIGSTDQKPSFWPQ